MATYLPVAKASFSQSASFGPIPLLTDGDDAKSRSGTIASGGGVVKRGSILKFDPVTNIVTQPVTAADCNCILVDDYDATSATVPVLFYVSGSFSAAAVVWPGVLNHGAVADALRNYTILIEGAIFTDGTLVKSGPKQQESAGAQAVVESNRADAEAAKTAAKTPPPAGEAKPAIDSPWAYLTAEEREKSPELAAVPTATELAGAAGSLPDAPPVTLSPASDSVAATPETSSFSVTMTAPGVGTWTATTAAPWLTIVSPTAPQSASGDVTYAVAANTGALRTGDISVNGSTFTVTQAAGA